MCPRARVLNSPPSNFPTLDKNLQDVHTLAQCQYHERLTYEASLCATLGRFLVCFIVNIRGDRVPDASLLIHATTKADRSPMSYTTGILVRIERVLAASVQSIFKASTSCTRCRKVRGVGFMQAVIFLMDDHSYGTSRGAGRFFPLSVCAYLFSWQIAMWCGPSLSPKPQSPREPNRSGVKRRIVTYNTCIQLCII